MSVCAFATVDLAEHAVKRIMPRVAGLAPLSPGVPVLAFGMEAYETFRHLLGLGLEPKDYGFLQVCLRGIIVFIGALIMVRLADRRFLSKMTAFDVILGFVLASALARAINGSAALFPTLVMGLLLVLLHRVMAVLAVWSESFGKVVKGEADPLIKNGKMQERALKRNHISEKDLLEAARQNGKVDTLDEIRVAVLERSGKISVIPAKNG